MMKVIQEVLGNPKKKENLLDPTDRLWLLNHTSYKVPQKKQMAICEISPFEIYIWVTIGFWVFRFDFITGRGAGQDVQGIQC